ncbi:MFS transporter [Sphingobium sp.]|uniref:spinster family MFS transporter n=1 Tax=Sphingobium sp. TaxID=1912891 RepID=UPI0028BF2BF0|nr:MFS transporter [Sphingobium sp.]
MATIDLQPAASGFRAWYVLTMLTLAVIVSYIDRYVLAVLVQPIKADLGFSDTELGLLTGFAFSAIYAVFGIPIARLADRGRRRDVIAISLVVWSVMTAICGAARSFTAFAFARFGVGAGEAGALPSSQALIADLFPPQQRNTALAVLGSGGTIGLLTAFLIGGLIEARLGWRMTFVVVSAPGVVLALLIWLTIAEPGSGKAAAMTQPKSSMGLLRELLADPLFRHIPLAQASLALLMFAQTQWLPAFFERSFDLPRMQIGPTLAMTNGLAGIAGMVTGGLLADRLIRRGAVWPVRVAIGGVLLGAAPMLGLYLSTTPNRAFACSAMMGFCLAIPGGPLLALVQSLVPREARATAAAAIAMCAAFIGLGGGPLMIGMISDWLAPSLGAQSLRWGMLITVGLTLPWCLFHFSRVARLLSQRGG